jgi:hypothetical protein
VNELQTAARVMGLQIFNTSTGREINAAFAMLAREALWAGGWFQKKKVPIGRARGRSKFAKPVLFLTKSVIIHHGKKRP